MGIPVQLSNAMRDAAPELVEALEPVHIADIQEEREAIYRFRYRAYVEELGRKMGNPDHTRRWMHDEEDDKPYSTLLYTAEGDEITGTIRLLHWGPGEVPEKVSRTFSMERFEGIDVMTIGRVARLVIRPDRRGQLGLVSLACALYQLCAEDYGVDVGFIHCATGLVRYYRLLGFRTYAGRLVEAADGIEVPLVYFPSDRAYLEKFGSVLAPFVDAFYGPDKRAPLDLTRYAHLLDADSAPVQVDPAAVWDRVSRFRGVEGSQPGVLEALSEDTVHKLTERGFVMDMPAGAVLTDKGLMQKEIFVILDGTFDVHDGDRRLRVIGRGDVIGEIGFFGSSGRRSASVTAASDGQVLVLRRRFLDELRESDPGCAADILFQLARVLADRQYV
jgi:hypothetical protein